MRGREAVERTRRIGTGPDRLLTITASAFPGIFTILALIA